MFRISRKSPWPPSIDLSTVRETLRYIEDDARRVPGLERVAAAITATIKEIEDAERKVKPVALKPMTARFLPRRH